jgi:HAD superfamily hydrolase (TIGR01490 family)
MAYALFDLDQTLLPYDTQALFANFVLKREGRRRLYLGLFAAAAPLRAVRLLGAAGMKRVFLSYLWRMPRARLTELAHEFAETIVPPLLYPEIMAEVERHRAAGRTLVLSTASPEFYATAIGRVLKFDHVFGTRILWKSDRMALIPKLDGLNNKHAEKIKRMRHLFESELSLPLPGSYAYSDSAADLPMLRYVDHAVAVNPDKQLAEAAEVEQWTILRPKRPQQTKLQFLCDCAWQAAGAWSPPQ